MRSIKESFFSFVYNLGNLKKLNYYRCKDLSLNTAHSSNDTVIEEIYSNRIDREMIFFHYFRVHLKIIKSNPSKLDVKKTVNHIYYFGYRFSSPSIKKLTVQNLPKIPWLSKEKILTFTMANLGKGTVNNNIIRKRAFIINRGLFNRVNFLSEEINDWTLCSIFLWPNVLAVDDSSETHRILHVFGIYKRDKESLNIEIKFGENHSDMKILFRELPANMFDLIKDEKTIINKTANIKNKNVFSLISVNKKKRYIIIIHMNKLSKESGINYMKEMEIILAEITLNLKYYS